MKLATVVAENDITPKIGVLASDEQHIILLERGADALDFDVPYYFTDMISFLQGDVEAREKAQEIVEFVQAEQPPGTLVPMDSVTLLSPVPKPESIRDCMAYEEHIINIIRRVGLKKFAGADRLIEKILGRKRSLAYRLNSAFYQRPIYYKSNRFSVVGHGRDVTIPAYTQMMDYELEFGVFLCKTGKDIPVKEASSFIGGFTIFNDFSARDIQLSEQKGRLGPAKGKDFDTGNAIGPYLVTPDEIIDPYRLSMSASVNGERWSQGNSSDMYWRFEDIIAYISRSETLYPGEFIGSGTCSGKDGCGCGLEMGRFLNSGDVVELTVDKIGTLRNKVI